MYVYVSIISMVVGPMVYGTCFCPVSRKEEVQQMGVAGEFYARGRKW